ncbi:TIGR04255 family protein [Ferruginibacter paludis]|uniref:TIGR04255 family protein n=1 Tax=Ferruginibacter paludis TaxID=1310417 RepID=UPI0025B5FC90|nr:TIGR04255 family protein [Ferruginibacter paludis]MDN3658941.1 TIGR04255 family protein [Ferruginibacter paludis]
MSQAKLKNAPLKEVIFELHWTSNLENATVQVDEGFDLAQGKFAEKVKSKYPVHKKMVPDGIPFKVFGTPLHQYWTGEFRWPAVQHGLGLLAVNDVEAGYQWEATYKPIVLDAIEKMISSYDEPLNFNRMKLLYVDAVDVNEEHSIPFIEANLRTNIQSNYPLPGKPKNINLFQSFELEDGSELHLTIATGVNNQNQNRSVIWTTTVEKKGSFKEHEILKWLESAHTAASNMFKNMLNPDFYASLDR